MAELKLTDDHLFIAECLDCRFMESAGYRPTAYKIGADHARENPTHRVEMRDSRVIKAESYCGDQGDETDRVTTHKATA